MKFLIDSKIFEIFPHLVMGVVIAKGINNEGPAEDVQEEIRVEEARIRGELNPETLAADPKIDVWRKAYQAFGAKPKEHRSSVENLYRLVLKGIDLRPINKLVDLYNLISLRHRVPVGGEDLDKINGDLELTFGGPNETPILLLGDKEPRPPHEGEVIYKDDLGTICRRWNWREADRTKLTEKTQNAILVIEGLPPVSRKEIENATTELQKLIEKNCGSTTTINILDKSLPQIEF